MATLNITTAGQYSISGQALTVGSTTVPVQLTYASDLVCTRLLSIVLHFAIRTVLAGSPERGSDPRRETVWAAIATVRGAAAIWNIVELVKVRGARRT